MRITVNIIKDEKKKLCQFLMFMELDSFYYYFMFNNTFILSNENINFCSSTNIYPEKSNYICYKYVHPLQDGIKYDIYEYFWS